MITMDHRVFVQASRGYHNTRVRPRALAQDHVPPDMDVARSANDVVDAWRLVYRVYRHAGLIDQNSLEIHTTAQTVMGNTVVFLRRSSGRGVDCTVTGTVDGVHGVPLDRVYGRQIDALRKAGRTVMELGLFAHRSQLDAQRRPSSLDEAPVSHRELAANARQNGRSLMCMVRPTYWYGLYHGVTDYLIGVHPKHVRTYARAWGFRPFGPERSYALVNHKPVVLLRLDPVHVAGERSVPYALAYAMRNRIPKDVYYRARRPALRSVCLADETIRRYISARRSTPDRAA